MRLVEGRTWRFVAERYEDLDDFDVAERRGEVEIRVGEAARGGVGVVEESGVGFEDALDEEGVVRVDRAADAEGWIDPVETS